MLNRRFQTLSEICYLTLSVFLIAACSACVSSLEAENQSTKVPSLVKIERPKPDLSGRIYKSKTMILNSNSFKFLDCNEPNGYSLIKVKNYHEDEGITSRDVDIIISNIRAIKIEVPTDYEAKNFKLISVHKTADGFEIKTGWGGSLHYYEIQFSFSCEANHFYLSEVRTDSFTTTNSEVEYLDKKKTNTLKIKPKIPIENFLVSNYLN